MENRLSRAARPTVSGCPPYEWTYRESNPDFQSAELVSSPWTTGPRSVSQGSGVRTHALQLPRLADYLLSYPLSQRNAYLQLRRPDLNRRRTAYETVLEPLQSTPQ